jgi:hypothetical protein
MARIRSVKPEFWGHPKTARLSRDARLLFLGLLNESDDEGRQLGSPRRIAGIVFPHDDDVTPELLGSWLDEIEREDMIRRYEVRGARLLLIVGFEEHQKVTHPSKSHLPGPLTSTPESLPRPSGESPESLPPDLGSRIVGSRIVGSVSEVVDKRVSGEAPTDPLDYLQHGRNPTALAALLGDRFGKDHT